MSPEAPAATLARAANAPWCAPLRPAMAALQRALSAGLGMAEVLDRLVSQGLPGAPRRPIRLASGPLRFVPQAALPPGEAYEAFIHRSAQVPTRDNLHDLFNGLQWWAQPALKARLNALQAAEIARAGIGDRRGPVRDALTLMDENGALLAAPPPLWGALRARDWRALFITHRAAWREARLVLLGHALLEQLATAPRKPLVAHVLDAEAPLALSAADWARKPFCPLPVLGVPGWWPANEDAAFYDDPAVFRPLRPARPAGPGAPSVAQAGRKPSIDR